MNQGAASPPFCLVCGLHGKSRPVMLAPNSGPIKPKLQEPEGPVNVAPELCVFGGGAQYSLFHDCLIVPLADENKQTPKR